jgi:hypothetical protein
LIKKDASRVNHTQRLPYVSQLAHDNPEDFHRIGESLGDVSRVVKEIIQRELPGIYDSLTVFCDVLPLGGVPATYPFPGFVINIQVCTDAHTDDMDDSVCVVIPFGIFEGGELVLVEAGLVLDLQEGDILIFPSHRYTHFNMHFKGVRGSVVLHADKGGRSWVKNRNGWEKHMAGRT